tara:strand:- start:269 stop:493 length:225 start_codon:yes stop_codon:yes gene_type:complete
MSKQTTFIVSGYVERHYRLEIEASSYEEAENKGYNMLNCGEPSHLYDYDAGTNVIVAYVECEDPEWDEESEEEL